MSVSLFAVMAASALSAAPRTMAECRALTNSAARLACYDTLEGQSAAPAPADTGAVTRPAPSGEPIQSAPTTGSYARPAAAPAQNLAKRSGFNSRIASVVPLRHGYYRLVLEDGSAYLTTAVAPPPAVGADVHIRRTLVGTTYLDTKGRDPIAIRLARQQ